MTPRRISFDKMTPEDLRRRLSDFSVWIENCRMVQHLVLGFARCTVSGETLVRYREVPEHPSDFDFVRNARTFLAEHRPVDQEDPCDG